MSGWSPRRIANEAAQAYLAGRVAHDWAFHGRVRAALFEDDGSHHRSGQDMEWTYSDELLWDTPSLDLPYEVGGLPLHIERWSRDGDLDPGGGQWLEVSRTSMSDNVLAYPRGGYELRTSVALCGSDADGQAETLFAVTGWGAHPTAADVGRMARMAVSGYERYGASFDVPAGAVTVDLAPRA
jgi:hypothetical protein